MTPPLWTCNENVSGPTLLREALKNGKVNVGLAVAAPVRATVGPPVWVHANVAAPVEPDPSSVTLVPRCTVWFSPALATGAVAAVTVTVTVAVDEPAGPVTVSENV